MKPSSDVAIIGGGFAGLAAARVLAQHGASVVILEATERLGGRARTIEQQHEHLPVELGPEFVHGHPEATVDLVRQAGLEIEEISEHHFVRRGRQLSDGDDVWQQFGELLEDAEHAPSAESAGAYMERTRMTGVDAWLFAHFVEGFYGAALDDISVASIAADASGASSSGDPAQARLVGGYGRLVDWLASQLARDGVPVKHGCFATAIDWRSDPVRIEYRTDAATETLAASRAIVALPVGVLEESVRFAPELGDHRRALDNLAMGQVVKVVICLREPIWQPREPRVLSFVHGCEQFPTFWMRSNEDSQQLTAWAGGPHARALAGVAADGLAARAIAGFAKCVDLRAAQIEAAVECVHFLDFAADACARGAYSYTRPGGAGAAEILARPLADRVFFAGEATDAEYEGTVAGALASGTRAANDLLRRAAHRHRGRRAG